MSNEETNPFQSPQTLDMSPAASVQRGELVGVVHPFQSGHTRAMWAVGLIMAVMGTGLLLAGSTYLQIGMLERAGQGQRPTREEALRNDARQRLLGLAHMAIYLSSAIPFLMWFHRAHRNLPALGNRRVDYTPGWAVGAWFVPILNLFRPCQIMGEVWRGSNPKGIDPSFPARRRGSALVGWWWASFILMGVSGAVGGELGHVPTIDAMLAASWFSIARSLIAVPGAALAILVVVGVDANQQKRYELLLQQAALSPSPFAPVTS